MNMPRVTLIVARARNGVIGSRNALPWRLPEDLRYFKATTFGHPVIIGRKTFDSIGKPLPGRRNIVVTRDAGWQQDGCERAGSVAGALELAAGSAGGEMGGGEIFVAGGAEIYRQAMAQADRLLVTEVDLAPEGDVYFPDIDSAQWRISASQEHRSATGLAYQLVEYVRVR